MTLAQFPLGAIALWQTQQVVDAALALSRAAVLAETERAAAAERKLLERAHGAAEGLSAPVATLTDDPAACSALMAEFIDGQEVFAFAGFIRADGLMDCASNGAGAKSTGTSRIRPASAASSAPLRKSASAAV